MSKSGIVKWFSADKGYGFIACEGKEYFAHFKDIQREGFKTLGEGEIVNFEPEAGAKGPVAKNIHVPVD